ncbi:lipid transfer-like protein VAS [Asparagus officinalis]|uniref:lipid transfer-like protein VAS n=1 Tax=Asparagus officinalis TaxID=4686 RepID=UPI00098DFDD9|nr:lipid transfer-like protein VAS [Asparagus officinalis]
MKKKMKISTLACLLALFTLATMSRAQDSACLNELVPCLQYIKSKKTPSRDCCDPLKSLIKSDPGCLCSMLGGSSATKQAKVNMTEAMFLPVRCGEHVSASMCSKVSRSKNKGSSSGSRFVSPDGMMILCLLLLVQIALVLIV